MNTIYRIVWNAATGKWVVASELAKGRKKKSARSMASVIALTAAVAGVGFTGYASAQTLGNNVTQGNAGNVVLGDNAAGASACTADPSLPAGAYGCSVVIGNTASAATGNTVVIGDHASTTANASVAIGAYSTAGKYSQAIGAGAQATGGWATAIGQSAQATSTNATAIGTNSTATGDAATAIGGGAHATADKSFAMGWSSNATGTGSMAFGYQVTAAGENAIAMGLSSQANADNAVALGSGAHANATNSVALGANSDAGTRTDVVSVGAVGSERQIINVAAGMADTDAVNVSQMKASGLIDSSGDPVVAVIYDQNTDGSPNYNSVTMGNGQSTGPVAIHNVAAGALSATSTDAVNGSQLYATNQQVSQNTTNINNLTTQSGLFQAKAASNNGKASATGSASVSIGANSAASQGGGIAIGGSNTNGAHATAVHAISIGEESAASGSNSIAMGFSSQASNTNAIALGDTANVSGQNSVGLGAGSTATAGNAVALGANSVADRANTVSVGSDIAGSAFTSQIVNVGAGTQANDAVNVSQLTPVVASLGGGASIDSTTGAVTGPTYNVQGGKQTNVGDALDALDTGVNNRVAYDQNADGSTNYSSVTMGNGQSTGPVAIHNVAAGALSATSTDAVNGSQLYATNQQVSQNTTDITNVQNSVAASTRYFQANGKNDGTDDASATGQNAVAVGASALASATQATALGANSVATQAGATAIGAGAQAPAQGSTAIGANSVAAVVNATAIGNSAQATAQNATAIGPNSVANVANTISVGSASNQRRITNVAAGTGDTDAVNVAQLKSSGLINNDGDAVAAVTYDQNADGTPNYGSVTMGGPVSTDGGVTGGTKITNVAQGNLSATSTDAVNGSQLYATNQQVSQNTTDITNLQNGVAASTRYFQANGKNDGTDDASAGGQSSVAVGASASASAERSVAVGQGATASLSEGRVAGANIPGYAGTPITNTAIGANTQASTGGTALGDSAQATGLASAAVGAYANSTGDFGTAVGFGAQATGSSSTALGVNAQATANNSVALGVSSVADRANRVSVGSAGKERQITNVAAGTEDTDAVNVAQLKSAGLVDDNGNTMDAVVYDAGTNRGQVTLGGVGAAAPVVLTNVANGVNQYDAVNFGQLSGLQTDLQNQINTVNGQVTNIDNRVTTLENNGGSGGGTPDYVAANASAQPSAAANVGDTTGVALGYNTAATGDNASAVGDSAQATGDNSTAIGSNAVASNTGGTALGSSASVNASNGVAVGNNATVASSASNGTAIGSGSSVSAASGTAVGQGASVASTATNSVALGAGSVATQANSVSVGSAGNERTITNVSAGVNATDAVNVSQLQSTQNWAQSYVDQKANQLNSRITSVGRHADAGTAGAIAMTNIPQAYQPNQSSIGAGVGAFNGQAAVAVGMSTVTPGGRWVLKGSLTGTTQGDVGVGFGASMVW